MTTETRASEKRADVKGFWKRTRIWKMANFVVHEDDRVVVEEADDERVLYVFQSLITSDIARSRKAPLNQGAAWF